jgi:hypothetical protein
MNWNAFITGHTLIYINIGQVYFFKNAKIFHPPPYNTICNVVIQSPSSSYANVKSEVLTVMTTKGCHLLVCAFLGVIFNNSSNCYDNTVLMIDTLINLEDW